MSSIKMNQRNLRVLYSVFGSVWAAVQRIPKKIKIRFRKLSTKNDFVKDQVLNSDANSHKRIHRHNIANRQQLVIYEPLTSNL